MELTIGADTAQQILALLINMDKKIDAMDKRMETMERRMEIMEKKIDALTDRVTILEKKVVMVESRQIDIEQKFTAMDIQMESRFYSLEVLLDKNAEPPAARKTVPRQVAKGRD